MVGNRRTDIANFDEETMRSAVQLVEDGRSYSYTLHQPLV